MGGEDLRGGKRKGLSGILRGSRAFQWSFLDSAEAAAARTRFGRDNDARDDILAEGRVAGIARV